MDFERRINLPRHLNLFAEYIDNVKIDSFTVSIMTAIVLKLVLEGVYQLQHFFHHVFCHPEGTGWKVVGGFSCLVSNFSSFGLMEFCFPIRSTREV
jgi:hypothetical protein